MSQPFELESGSSKLIGNMNNGVLDGPFKVFDAKKPLAAMQYQQGKLHGPMKMLHPNGKPSALLAYQAGVLHGPAQFSPRRAFCSGNATTTRVSCKAHVKTILITVRWPS